MKQQDQTKHVKKKTSHKQIARAHSIINKEKLQILN